MHLLLDSLSLGQMIVRKFTNYRNQVYLKNRPPAPIPSVIGGPLFRFSSGLTGRQLFAKDNSTLINSTAAARIATADHGSLAAVYQTVLRELWDALPESKQLEWGQRAEEGMGDTDQYASSSLLSLVFISTQESVRIPSKDVLSIEGFDARRSTWRHRNALVLRLSQTSIW